MYDRRKRLKRTMHLLEPIFSVSFLNDRGDIVAALDKTLVVVRADTYQYLTADEMSMLVAEHAKSQQPLAQAPANIQKAAMQLAKSGSKSERMHLARQLTLGQVSFYFAFKKQITQIYAVRHHNGSLCAQKQPETLPVLHVWSQSLRLAITADVRVPGRASVPATAAWKPGAVQHYPHTCCPDGSCLPVYFTSSQTQPCLG